MKTQQPEATTSFIHRPTHLVFFPNSGKVELVFSESEAWNVATGMAPHSWEAVVCKILGRTASVVTRDERSNTFDLGMNVRIKQSTNGDFDPFDEGPRTVPSEASGTITKIRESFIELDNSIQVLICDIQEISVVDGSSEKELAE